MIERDLVLSSGGYIAEISSHLGGNCYRLRNEALDLEILNTPLTEAAFAENPMLFGNPILFPPNRTRGGEFSFRGRCYRFPINEPATGCHLHGELHKTHFEISEYSGDRAVLKFKAEAEEYLGFPHRFEIVRDYSLGRDGLTERVTVRNLSDEPMPFTLAYHTTFNLAGLGKDCRLLLPVGREQLRDERYLPTLEWATDRDREYEMRDGRYEVYSKSISALYECHGKIGRITDPVSRKSIICECSEEFGYRMLWRREGADFLCIEPQTCAIDLFHLDTPPEENGLIVISPGEAITACVRYAADVFADRT